MRPGKKELTTSRNRRVHLIRLEHTSGYHHGLFDSPFYRASRNVFFLLVLLVSGTLALLVPSIHPSSVPTIPSHPPPFLPLMANRLVFLEARFKFRFLILHEFVSHRGRDFFIRSPQELPQVSSLHRAAVLGRA